MLKTAVQLHSDMEKGSAVPEFCWLLFARDSSKCPKTFLTNHLRHVGFSGGLEQVSAVESLALFNYGPIISNVNSFDSVVELIVFHEGSSPDDVMLFRWRCASWVIPFSRRCGLFGCTSVTLKSLLRTTLTTTRRTGLVYSCLQKMTDTTMYSSPKIPPNLMQMEGQSGIHLQLDNQA